VKRLLPLRGAGTKGRDEECLAQKYFVIAVIRLGVVGRKNTTVEDEEEIGIQISK